MVAGSPPASERAAATLARKRPSGLVLVDKAVSPSVEAPSTVWRKAARRCFDTRPKTSTRRKSILLANPNPRRSTSHVKKDAGACGAHRGTGRAGPAGHGPGRHLRCEGPAAVGRHQLALGDLRRLPRHVHAGRVRVPGDR